MLSSLDGLGQTNMPVEVFIAKYTELSRKSLAYSLNVGGTGHRQSELPLRTHGEPVKFFIRQASISVTLRIGQRSQHKSIFHLLTGLKLHGLIETTVRQIGFGFAHGISLLCG